MRFRLTGRSPLLQTGLTKALDDLQFATRGPGLVRVTTVTSYNHPPFVTTPEPRGQDFAVRPIG